MIKRLIFIFYIFFTINSHANNFAIEDIKKASVSITTTSSYSVSDAVGKFYGSGFVVNLAKGIILTNNHVVLSSSASNYRVTFHNGIEMEAKLMYSDPWHDFAFLRVDPEKISKSVVELPLNENNVYPDQEVIIMGKNEGREFSFHVGHISSIYEMSSFMPTHSFIISLNAQGGASGSPVVNKEGQVIALVYAKGESYALAMHIGYIIDALGQIIRGYKPQRKHNGIMLDYYSLNHANEFANFPESEIESYIDKFPYSLNKALIIRKMLIDSPAEKSGLRIGDIILQVNGQEIGPNLIMFDRMLNDSDNKVNLTVFRDGKQIEIKTGLYNLYKNEIKEFIYLGGAIFYQANDVIANIISAKAGDVFITSIAPGSSFYHIFPGVTNLPNFIKVNKIGDYEINNLNDIKKIIPNLCAKKTFRIFYQNYGLYQGYDRAPFFERVTSFKDIRYNKIDPKPKIFNFVEKEYEWQSRDIK